VNLKKIFGKDTVPNCAKCKLLRWKKTEKEEAEDTGGFFLLFSGIKVAQCTGGMMCIACGGASCTSAFNTRGEG